jgi:transposase
MTHSIDLRKRVVEFVQNSGSKAEAARRYKVSLWCVNDWCKRDDLTPQPQLGRKRKLDWEALSRHIQENPDALIRERAQHFGVHNNAIWYAKSQMKLTRKKKLLNIVNVGIIKELPSSEISVILSQPRGQLIWFISMNQVLRLITIAHMLGQNVDINPLESEAVNEELALV